MARGAVLTVREPCFDRRSADLRAFDVKRETAPLGGAVGKAEYTIASYGASGAANSPKWCIR